MNVADQLVWEALKFEARRRDFLAYLCDCYPKLDWHPWQIELCQALMNWAKGIENKTGPRLIVNVPPQCGKSTIVSRAFPAWLAGRHPEWSGIMASYGASLAAKHGRWIRNRLESRNHLSLFPNGGLSGDSRAMDNFQLAGGGQIISRGVEGGTTGEPATWAIVDDPISTRQDAQSRKIRDAIDDWHSSVISTRLAPGGGELLMHTRWHVDDQVGRLQAREKDGGDHYTVLSFAAENPDGTWLQCRYSPAELQRKKRNMLRRDWLSLYQQAPCEDGRIGGEFDVSKIGEGNPPPWARILMAVDPTSSKAEDADKTGVVVVAQWRVGEVIYWCVVHADSWRADIGESAKKIVELIRTWKPAALYMESGPTGLSMEVTLRREMREKTVHVGIRMVSHCGGDKLAKASAAVGAVNNGVVYAVKGGAWWPGFREQLATFTGEDGNEDDLADAFGILIRQPVIGPEAPAEPKAKTDEERLRELVGIRKEESKQRKVRAVEVP